MTCLAWLAIVCGAWLLIGLASVGGVLWAIAHAVEVQDELQ